MKPVQPLQFTNVTPEWFEAIKKNAKPLGLNIESNKGLLQWDGCGIDYQYDEGTRTLKVLMTVPFHVSEMEAEGAIHNIVRASNPNRGTVTGLKDSTAGHETVGQAGDRFAKTNANAPQNLPGSHGSGDRGRIPATK